MSPQHHEIIRKHRIRTFCTWQLVEDNQLREEIVQARNKWLVKPCLFGKGEGIQFGKDFSDQEWCRFVQKLVT